MPRQVSSAACLDKCTSPLLMQQNQCLLWYLLHVLMFQSPWCCHHAASLTLLSNHALLLLVFLSDTICTHGYCRVFTLAKERDLDLDFHVDENGNERAKGLLYIARKTIQHGYQGRVVCGHCWYALHPTHVNQLTVQQSAARLLAAAQSSSAASCVKLLHLVLIDLLEGLEPIIIQHTICMSQVHMRKYCTQSRLSKKVSVGDASPNEDDRLCFVSFKKKQDACLLLFTALRTSPVCAMLQYCTDFLVRHKENQHVTILICTVQ